MNTIIKLDDVEAEIYYKRIRNIHLRVIPPDGKVRISAPFRVKNEVIYKFAYSKLDWIKKQINTARPPPQGINGCVNNVLVFYHYYSCTNCSWTKTTRCKNLFQLFSFLIKTKVVQNVNRMSERHADRQSD